MRIALFGGTFDPIHRGHLAIAAAAADAFALDRVLFAPVGHQPLKPAGTHASYADRLAMVTLACAGLTDADNGPGGNPPDPRFTPSTLDAPHADGTPNYTVEALTTLATQQPQAALFVLTGADSFLDLHRWRSPARLLELAEWIVVSRPGHALTEARMAPLALDPGQRARVHLLTSVDEDISATELRRRLHAGDPCAGLIPPAVVLYIRAHDLYR